MVAFLAIEMFVVKLLLLLWLLFVASVVVVVVVANRLTSSTAERESSDCCLPWQSLLYFLPLCHALLRRPPREKGKIENAHNLAVKDFNHES